MSDEHMDTLFPIDDLDVEPVKKTTATVPMADINKVFDYWVATMRNKGRGAKPRLDNNRKNAIGRGILGYGVDGCMDAIRGCALSEWHMGNNPQGKVYDELTLILRNATQIEKFINLAANEKKGWEYE